MQKMPKLHLWENVAKSQFWVLLEWVPFGLYLTHRGVSYLYGKLFGPNILVFHIIKVSYKQFCIIFVSILPQINSFLVYICSQY